MTDFDAQRIAMVESQLRPNQVTDRALIAAMRSLPRERFVPEPLQGLAYIDEDIQVLPERHSAQARALLSPIVQARLIQLAEVQPQHSVLDVGCATGYSTAVLARLAARVVGLESEPELAAAAKINLASCGAANADIVAGDFAAGYAAGAHYDVIVVEGSVPNIPDALLGQLKIGGRLVAVRTRAPNVRQGNAYLFVRVNGETSGTAEFDAGASPLPGFAPAPSFAF
ncbi:MAG: protein-L-isoaspartate O-methyltransferase family protein [Alphaproteobacteria bacterium]